MRLLYNDAEHRYWYEEKPNLKLTSVSTLIGKYHEKFDMELRSKKYAEKHGRDQQEVKDEWELKGRLAREKGTKYHNMREQELYENANVHRHPIEGDNKIGLDISNLKPGIYPELILDHPYYGLVGTSDKVEIFEDNTFNLSDYKTNEKLEFSGFMVFNPTTKRREEKKMFSPLSHLPDANGIHYSLQLSLYAYFLEERGYKLKDLWIEHIIFEDDEHINVIKYPINYLKKDVITLCNHYKMNNPK